MKICWDMLEGVYLTRNGVFRKGSVSYTYKESCEKCGESYLTSNSRQSVFCSSSCYRSGKHPTIETRKKMSIAAKGKNNQWYGMVGVLSSNYKGGVTKMGLTTYDTYKNTLGLYEEIRKQEGTEVLEVRCAYCGKWYSPTRFSVIYRLRAVNGLNKGECRLYCSEDCKQACPTYNRTKYPKGHNPHEVSKSIWYTDYELRIWREEVLKRANYKCEYCGEEATIAHHTRPKKLEPFSALDPDHGLACCEKCHYKYGHQGDCSTVNLARVNCK